MTALPLIIMVLAVFALAYRFYYSFICAKILALDDNRITPANIINDGQNYVPTSKWVLFGHHFAAIAGAGPLVGPVLACQFGFFPGFAWMIIGAVLAGGVHDTVILTASVRSGGKSLVAIARSQLQSKSSEIAVSVATLMIIVIVISGLGLVVVNALAESIWGTFTIASTIPIAIMMGIWMFKVRKGKTAEATIVGVLLLIAAVIFGKYIPESPIASWFSYNLKH